MPRKIVLAALIGLSLAAIMASSTFAIGLWVRPGTSDPERSGIVKALWAPNEGVADGRGDHPALLLGKNGPSVVNASAGASLFGVAGLILYELGWDVRDDGYCGETSPRFFVVTTDEVAHDIGCTSPSPTSKELVTDARGTDWKRLRYDPQDASPPISRGSRVKLIGIIFDAGTDVGSGFVHLDNIEINGMAVSQAPHR